MQRRLTIVTRGTGAPVQLNPDRYRLDSDSVTEEISKCYHRMMR